MLEIVHFKLGDCPGALVCLIKRSYYYYIGVVSQKQYAEVSIGYNVL